MPRQNTHVKDSVIGRGSGRIASSKGDGSWSMLPERASFPDVPWAFAIRLSFVDAHRTV